MPLVLRMTDLAPPPKVPTCPLCATQDRVGRERGHWLCVRCWTLFTGSPGEWELMRVARDERASRFEWAERDRQEAVDA